MAASPMQIGMQMLGKGEVPDRAAIRDYLATGGVNLDPVTTAWCAAYVNASLQQAGIQGTGSNLARSFLNWGQAADTPQPGDIGVLPRGDPKGPYGHVGFVNAVNPDGTVTLLAGNQGNKVSEQAYPLSQFLGFRRAAQQAAENARSPEQQPQAQPMGSMSPQVQPVASEAAPAPIAVPSTPTDDKANKAYLSLLGSMAPKADQATRFSPVNIQGPSADQANGLLKLVQALKDRMAQNG